MKRLDQSGLTIVELMVSIGIAGILASSLLIVSLSFFGDTIRNQITSQMLIDSHFALRALTEDLRLGNGIEIANTLADANEPGGGWATSSNNNVLIVSTPAIDYDNQVIYDETTGDPYHNELIYYLEEGVLYKRLLNNPGAPDNKITTTCPELIATSDCPADREYTSHVQDIEFAFYDVSNVETADPALARSVKVDLLMSRRVFGKTVTFDNSILVKLRN